MKLSKNTWTIVAILGIVAIIYWVMKEKIEEESNFPPRPYQECKRNSDCFGNAFCNSGFSPARCTLPGA